MLFLLAALSIAADPPVADVGARMRQSAAAAQALQGPLDGAWALYDGDHRPLLELRITDPPPGAGQAPQGVWRRAGDAAPPTAIGRIERRPGHLRLTLAEPGDAVPTILRLSRRGLRVWVGWMRRQGRTAPVVLRRAP